MNILLIYGGESVAGILLTITKYSDIICTFCYALVHGQSSRGQAGL
jgi:hypothetical protein